MQSSPPQAARVSPMSPPSRPISRPQSNNSPPCLTGDRHRSTPTAAFWWSARQHQECRLQTSCDEQAATLRSRSVSTSGCRVRYRGCDIYRWLEWIGQLDERWNEVEDLQRARRHASVQVVGSDDGRKVDLTSLQGVGVQLVGRLMAIRDRTAFCSGGLRSLVANADLKQARLLRRIDEWVREHDMADVVGPAAEPTPTVLAEVPTELDLRGFGAVIWATGFRPAYAWLDRRALGHRNRVDHDGGVASMPGLYLLGLPFLRRRRSNLIGGLGSDAAELCQHLVSYLEDVGRVRTRRHAEVKVTSRP